MARDSSLFVRKAVVTDLKDDATGVGALVADRVHGPNPPATPEWPFVRVGTPTIIPFRATCLDGARLDLTIHGFARGEDETECAALAAALASRLDGRSMPLQAPYAARLTLTWVQTQIIKDSDEATGWHALVRFEAKVAS